MSFLNNIILAKLWDKIKTLVKNHVPDKVESTKVGGGATSTTFIADGVTTISRSDDTNSSTTRTVIDGGTIKISGDPVNTSQDNATTLNISSTGLQCVDEFTIYTYDVVNYDQPLLRYYGPDTGKGDNSKLMLGNSYVKVYGNDNLLSTDSSSCFATTKWVGDKLSSELGSYAKTSDLNGYAKTSALSDYVKTTALSSYAKKDDIPTSLPANGGSANYATSAGSANTATSATSATTATQIISRTTDGMGTRTTFYPYYIAGDRLTGKWKGGGYVTTAKKEVVFTVPLARPIVGSPTISVTASLIIRQGSKYTHGSSSSTKVTPSSYEIERGIGDSICITCVMSDLTNAVNNDACAVAADLTITFS